LPEHIGADTPGDGSVGAQPVGVSPLLAEAQKNWQQKNCAQAQRKREWVHARDAGKDDRRLQVSIQA